MIALDVLREKKRKLIPPRELDSVETLKNYLEHFGIKPPVGSTRAELANLVAKHFDKDLEVEDEEVLPSFVQFILEYNGGNIATPAPREKRSKRSTTLNFLSLQKENDTLCRQQRAVYCICKNGSYGEMIACDGENCKIEWFHVGCVGIENIAQLKGAKWYCPDCKKSSGATQSANRSSRRRKDD